MSSSFLVNVLVFPALLAALAVGAGLLVDRVSGSFLPGALLPAVGAAALIGVSQLTTYAPSLAPDTPYALVGFAAAGYLLGGHRALALGRALPGRLGPVAAMVAAYLVGIAPVLAAGRLTFSGYGVLPDSALHMIGADYLIRHGQEYAHLDLRNSYGQYISAYFNTSYPSGAHTFFGGSARLLDLPLIWALQPFCAFILATAAGPAWVLARRVGLAGAWAALAALTVTVPALVYGYELVASLKEVTALPLILTLGALVAGHRPWLHGPPTGAIPFALVVAGGVSALGIAFGAWVLAAAVVVLVLLVVAAFRGGLGPVRVLGLVAVGALAALVAAWPTWQDVSGSVQVAQGIAATSNPGNLTAPLHLEQIVGSWLAGSYRHRAPMGTLRTLTHVLVGFSVLAAVLGAIQVIRIRAWAVAAWMGLLLALWLGLTFYGTTWADAKLLMLTAPIVVLLAWAGVAGLRASPLRLLAPVLGLVVAGGIVASDVAQYHGNDLAPTDRYQELATLDSRYAGQGPVLFTDFDEWSLYQLRDLDVGGPDFIFPPAGLTSVAIGHGDRVDLDRVPPAAFAAYPLIITRRDPTASRPPTAYRRVWEGSFYQVWARRPGAPVALAHLRLTGTRAVGCPTIRPLVRLTRAHHAKLVSATRIPVVSINLTRTEHATWKRDHPFSVGLLMTPDGYLTAGFRVPRAGVWNVWIQGEVMPLVRVALDGHHIGSLAAEVSGNAFNPDTMVPLPVAMTAGSHRLTISRGALTAGPGDGGSDLLHAILIAPAGAQERVRATPPSRWRSLCGRRFDWIEVTRT